MGSFADTYSHAGGSRYCGRHRQACRHSIHQSSITTPVHCAVIRELSAGIHGHIQSASSGGGAARRWLARGGRRKVGAFSSLLPKSEWPKAKSLKEKVRGLESSFQKVYTLGALALQDFFHRLLNVGHFQWFRWGRGILRTQHVTPQDSMTSWFGEIAGWLYLLYMALQPRTWAHGVRSTGVDTAAILATGLTDSNRRKRIVFCQ